MADAGRGVPPLYIAAWIVLGIGIGGLGSLFFLSMAPNIFEGLLYLFLGAIAFGIGEILNHRKPGLHNSRASYLNNSPKFHRKRNSCSLGNLCDIGAILLFFVSLSTLLFPQ